MQDIRMTDSMELHKTPAQSWRLTGNVSRLPRFNTICTGLVALVFITSFYTLAFPSPCDLFLVLALLACLGGGLQLSFATTPLLLLLLVYNLSALVSYMLVPFGTTSARDFLLGVAFTSTSAVFLSSYIAADPVRHFSGIMRSWWIGATLGSVIGLASYFGLPPFAKVFPDLYGRVAGAYKDPNVFSTWLVFPIVTMLQAFIIGNLRLNPWNAVRFIFIFAALFLAFSRGAWINSSVAVLLMITMTFLLTPSSAMRGRIVLYGIASVVAVGLLLVLLLSIPEARDLFLDRFTLFKSYDAGETGRFGNQLNSIPMLIDQPFGFGPMQYTKIFNLDPHNTFLNAFASGGWIAGVCYLLLVISTYIVGIKAVLLRSPVQPFAICCLSCFITTSLQGVQIDMENWRHYFWLLGMVWGVFAASLKYVHNPLDREDILTAWSPARARAFIR
jgi:O-Antigen ligase